MDIVIDGNQVVSRPKFFSLERKSDV